jgi:predicted DNA-binding transcriptional regulator YafY
MFDLMDYKQLRRLNILTDQLGSFRRKTFAELMRAFVDNDILVDERTVRRDLKTLREEFGLDYHVDRKSKTYHIPSDISDQPKKLAESFAKLDSAYMLNSLNLTTERVESLMSIDHAEWETGLRNVRLIIEAISQRKVVLFHHLNYDTLETNERSFAPCFIKEHARTWYMYGYQPTKPERFHLYGLDRVRNLRLSMERFSQARPLDEIRTLFKEHIGVTLEENATVETVILKSRGRIGQLLKHKPLHPSQTAKQDGDDVILTLRVRPNIGLEQEILKHGEEILVLEPPSLVASIRARIERMSNRYLE